MSTGEDQAVTSDGGAAKPQTTGRARIGVDLGGTKIEAILLGAAGEVLERRRVASPRGNYEATLDAVAALVRQLEEALATRHGGPARRLSVGVGIPGALSPATGLVKNANSTWLIGKPLDRDLEQRLARPVRVANDANCFAVSEAVDGAGAGARLVFGVILGTGVGGGIAIEGRPLLGANAIAGEWGHNPLPWPKAGELEGRRCYCGREGCIETFLSGPAFESEYRRASGRTLVAAEIAKAASSGEQDAEAAMARYEERLARGLAHVINLLDPEVILLGGGLSNLTRLYDNVPRLWGRFVFSDRVDTRLLPPLHGDSSGVRGAAWLWPPDPEEGAP
ncbi:ROK family protein [Hypericibacter sp.]|uniref:ROK family protein n=1 Tax=Hypericibacter sp. TaxID=2705401 RepID=UPI003D6D1C09